ncbi:hypothetical protein OF846_005053 [Rhodotorula toruloides]|nr:hypothetical protein OF846_005053 [Rhodotorula toruloides]KAJ8291810.1 hypothetical protein OF846_005053 [Rhodotorula toruloides]KAJ8291811.1 hypothetical protein OF846_005053 [Rhodotorula toruloides]
MACCSMHDAPKLCYLPDCTHKHHPRCDAATILPLLLPRLLLLHPTWIARREVAKVECIDALRPAAESRLSRPLSCQRSPRYTTTHQHPRTTTHSIASLSPCAHTPPSSAHRQLSLAAALEPLVRGRLRVPLPAMGIQNLIPDLVKEVELLPAQRVLSTHHSASEAIKEVQRENKADGLQGDGRFGILEDSNPILVPIQRQLAFKHRRKPLQAAKGATIAGLQSFIDRLKQHYRSTNVTTVLCSVLDGLLRPEAKRRECIERRRQSARDRRRAKRANTSSKTPTAAPASDTRRLATDPSLIRIAMQNCAKNDPNHIVVDAKDEADRAITQILLTLEARRQGDDDPFPPPLDRIDKASDRLSDFAPHEIITSTGDSDDLGLYTGSMRGWCIFPTSRSRIPPLSRPHAAVPAAPATPAQDVPNPALPKTRGSGRDPTLPSCFLVKGAALDELPGFGDDFDRRCRIAIIVGHDYSGTGLPRVTRKVVATGLVDDFITADWSDTTSARLIFSTSCSLNSLWSAEKADKNLRATLDIRRIPKIVATNELVKTFALALETMHGGEVETFDIGKLYASMENERTPRTGSDLEFTSEPPGDDWRPPRGKIPNDHPLRPLRNRPLPERDASTPFPEDGNARSDAHHVPSRRSGRLSTKKRRAPRTKLEDGGRHPRQSTVPVKSVPRVPRHPRQTRIRISPLPPSDLASRLNTPRVEPPISPPQPPPSAATDPKGKGKAMEGESSTAPADLDAMYDEDDDQDGVDGDFDDDEDEDEEEETGTSARLSAKHGLGAFYATRSSFQINLRQAERCVDQSLISPPPATPRAPTSTRGINKRPAAPPVAKLDHVRHRPLAFLLSVYHFVISASLPFIMAGWMWWLNNRLLTLNGMREIGDETHERGGIANLLAHIAHFAEGEGKGLHAGANGRDAAEAIFSTRPHLLHPPHLGFDVYKLALRPYHTAFWQATRRRVSATLRALGALVGRDMYGTLPTIVAQYFLDQQPPLTASAVVQSLRADDERKLIAAISAFLREQLVEAPFSITRARRVKPRAAPPPPPTAPGTAEELGRGKRRATKVPYGEQQAEDDEDAKSKKRKTPKGAAASKDKDVPPELTPSLDSVAGKALDDVLGKLSLQLAQRDAIRSDVLTALVTLLEIRDHGMIAPSKVTSTMANSCDGKTVKSILQQRSMARASSGIFLKLRQMTRLPLVPNFRPEFVDFNMVTITFLGDHLPRLIDGAQRMCMRTVAAVVPHLDANELLKEPNTKIRILDPVFKLFEVKPGAAGAPARSASPTHAFLAEYKRSGKLPQLTMKKEVQRVETLFRAFRSAFRLAANASMSSFVYKNHVAAEVANFFIRHELLPDNFECTGHMRASPSHLVVVGVRIDRVKKKCGAASFKNGLDGLDITRLDAGQLFAVALASHKFTTLELSAPRRADALKWYWDRDTRSLRSRRIRSLLDHIPPNTTPLEVLKAVEAARPPPSARQQGTVQERIRQRRSAAPALSTRPWRYDSGRARTFQGVPRDFLELK